MNHVILVAGGVGSRMGSPIPKQFLYVKDKPVIIHTLEKFEACPLIDRIYIACVAGWEETLAAHLEKFSITKARGRILPGGKTRLDSIFQVLKAIQGEVAPGDLVVTYDANRPIIGEKMIIDNLEKCREADGAIATHRCTETMYKINADASLITASENRDTLSIGTGPETTAFMNALKLCEEKSRDPLTNTLGELMLAAGQKVARSFSDPRCIKLTTPEDMDFFQAYLEEQNASRTRQ